MLSSRKRQRLVRETSSTQSRPLSLELAQPAQSAHERHVSYLVCWVGSAFLHSSRDDVTPTILLRTNFPQVNDYTGQIRDKCSCSSAVAAIKKEDVPSVHGLPSLMSVTTAPASSATKQPAAEWTDP
jgi:hypothetical protein